MKVAVVAHAGKTLGGGLPELRRVLATAGVDDPLWFEIGRPRHAPAQVRRALEDGADLVLAWGGDGTVRRCASALSGTGVDLGVLPAGSANLFASNLGIPTDLDRAVSIALHGASREIDVGTFGDERFTCLAGAGFDALLIRDSDRLKERIGKLAYLWGGAKNLRAEPFTTTITVDGAPWYEGPLATILVGNMGELFGGLTAFRDARPDDGRLDVGIVTADGIAQWTRTLARALHGAPERSPFVRVTQAVAVEAELDRKVPYQLDGGDRGRVDRFRVGIEPAALRVRVPQETGTQATR